jgi:hypothetical protein
VAQALIANTQSVVASKGLADYNTAIAAGYASIEDHKLGSRYEHLVKWAFLEDRFVMDPLRVESLVFRVESGGGKTLVSAMYILPLLTGSEAIPPEYRSELTPWHIHTNLCWGNSPTTGELVVVELKGADGECSPGTIDFPTPPMLHVWLEPTPCGPFAEVEGAATGDCGHTSH